MGGGQPIARSLAVVRHGARSAPVAEDVVARSVRRGQMARARARWPRIALRSRRPDGQRSGRDPKLRGELALRLMNARTHRQQRYVAEAVGIEGPAETGPERAGGRPYGHSLMAGSHDGRRPSVTDQRRPRMPFTAPMPPLRRNPVEPKRSRRDWASGCVSPTGARRDRPSGRPDAVEGGKRGQGSAIGAIPHKGGVGSLPTGDFSTRFARSK